MQAFVAEDKTEKLFNKILSYLISITSGNFSN